MNFINSYYIECTLYSRPSSFVGLCIIGFVYLCKRNVATLMHHGLFIHYCACIVKNGRPRLYICLMQQQPHFSAVWSVCPLIALRTVSRSSCCRHVLINPGQVDVHAELEDKHKRKVMFQRKCRYCVGWTGE